jgi:thiamine-phosphate pyrophosphorylase
MNDPRFQPDFSYDKATLRASRSIMAPVWWTRANAATIRAATMPPHSLQIPADTNQGYVVAKTKSTSKKSTKPADDLDWPTCQLMLTVTPGAGALEALRAAFGHCQPAAVLIRPKPEHHLGAGEVKLLVDLAQDYGAAALIYDDVRLARTVRADGVHLHVQTDGTVTALIAEARAALGPASNIGIDAGISRHRAMEAGEAGADYVAFGAAEDTPLARQARDDLVSWWSDIFEVPCVALDVVSAEAAKAESDGTDFVALTLPPGASIDAVMSLVGKIDSILSLSSLSEEKTE